MSVIDKAAEIAKRPLCLQLAFALTLHTQGIAPHELGKHATRRELRRIAHVKYPNGWVMC